MESLTSNPKLENSLSQQRTNGELWPEVGDGVKG